MAPNMTAGLAERIQAAAPGAIVRSFRDAFEAGAELEDADAVFGSVPSDVFGRAKKLRWIAAPMAGLGGHWFHEALLRSDVTVTNASGIYNEYLSTHAMALLLGLACRLDEYLPRQIERRWQRGRGNIDLTRSTALIVGVGGSGGELSRRCAAFGMRVLGCDPRAKEKPEGMEDLFPPEQLDERLAEADFVIITTPETPQTKGMFNAARFARMKRGCYLVSISRGTCVVTDDLVAALRSGQLAGAGLDVVDPEPLPPDHPLWALPGVLLTPHVAISGSENVWLERRDALVVENAGRFARGEPLLNVVDKANWF
jgi:phosphoglycerate dehydrogenase-like enzyme